VIQIKAGGILMSDCLVRKKQNQLQMKIQKNIKP
jgi:hypothetical protein